MALNTVQLGVNALLGLWLYMEYLNNRFMRLYLDNFWGANGLVLTAGLVGGTTVIGTFLFFSRKSGFAFIGLHQAAIASPDSPSNFVPLDMCPHCNVELKTVSENRFQCRQCRRYYKK